MTVEMTQAEARQLSQQCLGNPYCEAVFRQFASNLLPDAEQLESGFSTGKYIPEAFRDYITSYKRLAKTRDDGKEKLDVLAVKVKKSSQLLNARSMQRQFIARYLNGAYGGYLKDAALVAFHSDDCADWRLSLVYKDRIFRDGKVASVLSEPKRASFMVGPNELSHTAEIQFVDLLQAKDRASISRIREAFGVEVVTKEFFNEYRHLFLELKNIIQAEIDKNPTIAKEFGAKDINAQVYAKRMLGQIVFLYFLQKKGWLGVALGQKWGSGSHAFLKELFTANQNRDFFNDFLNPLFYDALATDRSANDHFFDLLGCRIPFLNGGLFEPLNGYDWRVFRLNVPNNFFEQLFNVFDRFNFTVREDEPLESEVAVDPEMLGKVFEGLLDVEERREKGTFYTPRHIVTYMCRESLAQYLDHILNLSPEYEENRDILPGITTKKQDLTLPGIKTKEKGILRWHRVERVPMADIQAFVRQDEALEEAGGKTKNRNKASGYSDALAADLPEAIKNHARSIDEALANVKICDPAIGSGAFAVGMMHEILRTRMALRAACPEAGLKSYTAYELKRDTIANSLYGVDLDPSAVDVAKLRLWLSLVVDENDYDQIKPLPNLDYKIMAGNSLDAARSVKNRGNLLYHEACAHLEKLQKEFYDLTNHVQKNEKRQAITAQRKKCGDIGIFDWYIDFFNVAGKFDIVIGNPPYIQIQGMDDTIKALKPQYKSFESTGDVYCLFYELGVTLLRRHGILAFITSNKWMRAAYGKSLRNFFLEYASPIKVIDFAGNKVFDSATVDVNIMILEKKKSDADINACIIKENCSNNMSDYIERNAVFTRFEVGQSWAILSPIEQSIKRKIEAVGKPLKEWDIRINYGIKTGFNEAFIINGQKKDELIAQDPKSAEIIRPILRGRDIKRYGYEFADQWLIATFPSRHYDIEQYPAVKKHLLSFGIERLEQTGKTYKINGKEIKARKKTSNKWFETQDSISYWEDFNKHRIVWSETMRIHKNIERFPRFSYLTNNYFTDKTTFIITGCNLIQILGSLNSILSRFQLKNLVSMMDTGGYLMQKTYIEKIFTVIPEKNHTASFIKLVKKLIGNQKNNDDVEEEIDELLIKQCHLNGEERKYLSIFPNYNF